MGDYTMIERTYNIEDNELYNDYEYLYDVLDHTLKNQNVDNAIFSVIFVEDEEIHTMNREYRGVDRVTDVISFAFEDNNDLVYNEIRMLGDIYICIPQMKRQAESYSHSEKRELSFLAVHGLLHLLGYDHMNEEDEKVMFALQELILNEQNITR
jgi:probable rRNA maturation factor